MLLQLPDYLESMLGKMAKEMPATGTKEDAEMSTDLGDSIADTNEGGDNGETGDAEVKDTGKVSDEQLSLLAGKLAAHWLRLAPKLGVADNKLEEIKKEESSEKDKCLALLNAWVDIEKEGATKDEIVYILEGLKLAELIEGVF